MSLDTEEQRDLAKPPELWWEIVKSIRGENPKVPGTIKPQVRRAAVPGGWLLEIESNIYIFVPDPEHRWVRNTEWMTTGQ